MTVTVKPRRCSTSGDFCCEAALQHRGLMLRRTFLVGAQLQPGALVEVPPQHRSIEMSIDAVHPSRPTPILMSPFVCELNRGRG
ncbi:hypothetical protein CKO44_19325 [Rubrivivax gelatinosus]|uniref:hypothetical protein n=1 Tax=Rubrivivax gelatinosus TaxID=28068 RepID=UPI001906014C|nr:hypothetical protein [Rubrivivax gelatinosus]MBK1615617.1 hypothetical protein [Rubrivivax gelatinosus]MBZ8143508.1 hypothetical protein [Rubrivivax gelatinosus]